MTDDVDYSPYKVCIETFSGPMDLLLYLIRRHEVEADQIPISKIADQYLDYIESMESIDVNLAGDFLVMAATLMELKSRLLLPQEDLDGMDEEDEGDPSAELVQRLLQYKYFKDLSRRLGAGAAARQRMFARPEEVIRIPKEWIEEDLRNSDPLEGLNLWDLLNAYTKVLQTMKPITQAKVTYEDVPLPIFFHRISGLLQQKSPRPIVELFAKADRSRMIGTFLAVLELVRLKKVTVAQTEAFGPIWVQWVTGASLSEEEVEEGMVSLGDQAQDTPDYDEGLDVTSRGEAEARRLAEAAAARAEEDHADIEGLRSRHAEIEQADEAEDPAATLPGFVAVEMELPEEHDPVGADADDGDSFAEFDEEDEIDRALSEVRIPDVDTGNILNYRMEIVEEQAPQTLQESMARPESNN